MGLSYRKFSLGYDFENSKEIISLIFINYFLLILFSFVLVLLHTVEEQLYAVSFRYHGIVLLCLVNILLIYTGWLNLAKYLLLLSVPFALIILPPLAGLSDNEFYFWFPYAPTAMSLMPHFVLKSREERPQLVAVLILYFLLVVFSDNLMTIRGGTELAVYPIIEAHNFYYNLVPIFIYLFVNLGLGLLFLQNQKFETELRQQRAALNEQNQKLSRQKSALVHKNRELDTALKELHSTQAQLIQSEKMASLGTLTAGIAHELNNPLNFISVSLEQIETEAGLLTKENRITDEKKNEIAGKLLEFTGYAREGTDRAAEIVVKLGSLKTRESLKRSDLRISLLVDDTLESISALIPESVTIEKKIPEDLTVNCQPEKMQKALLSIIENAIEAMDGKADGTLSFLAGRKREHQTDYVYLDIINSGSRIPKDIENKIFDPFFSTKAPGKYPGLGLSVVYNTMKQHAGKVTVSSADGSVTVCLQLPVI